ncbi:MAG TPA: prolyl oligopeptidase family serine peptidase, partial [Bryobacteraceae bacterium]|nr:prolyl oligopeptidase family serine peptidase [Bryobacteraceae bacterium]
LLTAGVALLTIAAFGANPPSRPVPPPGISLTAADKADLQSGLDRLAVSIKKLQGNTLLPDVQIYHEAVRYALTYGEFFKPDEIAKARELLRHGQARADELVNGNSPWTTTTGLVVRGYVSKIDGSVQPFGLVIPPAFSPKLPHRWRLDTWFHGRNETLSEVNFLADRERNPGEFTPPNTIVLHLYGRYCNANKLAGEVDLLEALEAVKRSYPIDENRTVVRGFSMGGAAVWHIAGHYAGDWAAAAPGAGFSETADFLKVFQRETVKPAWWEQKLWHLYDATDYAANFANTPVVAYNGEIDGQKQAADMMEKSLAQEGIRLARVVGPNTAHKYHPDSKVIINRAIDGIAERGRDPYPRHLRFTTFTLRYNRMRWLTMDALDEHWERARLDADIADDGAVWLKAANVSAFHIDMPAGACPLDVARKAAVIINGQKLSVNGPLSDRSWTARFQRTGGKWTVVQGIEEQGIAKRHGLQGPIDDAFMDSFLMVKPTGTPLIPAIAQWVEAEMIHAITEWRRQFRGDAQVKKDADLTDADIASSNLVLWGDPGSNKILARIADKLPIRWTADGIAVGSERYPAASSALVMIYPNPLNPKKYVVLNSGFTFREYDYLNNARQIPKLPDYAVVDTRTPPDDRWPGKIAGAGFFGERWELAARPSPATE